MRTAAAPATTASAEKRATLTREVVPDRQAGGRSLNESFRRLAGDADLERAAVGRARLARPGGRLDERATCPSGHRAAQRADVGAPASLGGRGVDRNERGPC